MGISLRMSMWSNFQDMVLSGRTSMQIQEDNLWAKEKSKRIA